MVTRGGLPGDDRLLTSAEVAEVFRVDRTVVTRWARQGRIPCIKTPGGENRYRESVVFALLNPDREEDDRG